MNTINKIKRGDVDLLKTECMHRDNALRLYQTLAIQSAVYPAKGTPFGLMYVALGLGEAGEVQNKVKKTFRDDGVIAFTGSDYDTGLATVEFGSVPDERKAQIIKELGGVLWYLAACCEELGVSLSDVALTNLEELCSRGERGTLQGDGDNR